MIKEKEQLLRRIFMGIDLCIITVSFVASFILRQNLGMFYRMDLFPARHVMKEFYVSIEYFNMLPLILFIWWAALTSSGLYESFRRKSFIEIIWGIIKSAFFVMIVLSTINFILKLDFISRTFMLLFFFMSCTSLIAERLFIVYFLRYLRKRGYNYRNILIVGTGRRAENFIKLIHHHSEWGLHILGLIDADKDMLDKTVSGEKVIGVLEDIPDILHKRAVDEVIFIVPRAWLAILEKSLLACEIEGVKTNIAADFFFFFLAHTVSSDI
ncbi:MAG: sugar transferase [Nitrospirae bacterium]|nr:sugar transferase [Nitrospirota bacterium]